MSKTFSVLNLMVIACTQQSPSISWLISLALVAIESVKLMISNALRHMVAENLRILNVKKSDPFDLICPDEVESVLGLDSDYNFWFTADSVYRLADLIDPYSIGAPSRQANARSSSISSTIAAASGRDLDGWAIRQKETLERDRSGGCSPFAREYVWAGSDRPWYQVPGHSLSGLPLSSSKTIEGTDYE